MRVKQDKLVISLFFFAEQNFGGILLPSATLRCGLGVVLEGQETLRLPKGVSELSSPPRRP